MVWLSRPRLPRRPPREESDLNKTVYTSFGPSSLPKNNVTRAHGDAHTDSY
jgi:hypothetical protein